MTRKTKSSSGLPKTVGGQPDPVGDLIKQAEGQRGLSLKQADKEMSDYYRNKSGIYKGEVSVSNKTRQKAVSAKAKATGDFYNRGQRVSKNVEDATGFAGTPYTGSGLYSKGFFKHTIKGS